MPVSLDFERPLASLDQGIAALRRTRARDREQALRLRRLEAERRRLCPEFFEKSIRRSLPRESSALLRAALARKGPRVVGRRPDYGAALQ